MEHPERRREREERSRNRGEAERAAPPRPVLPAPADPAEARALDAGILRHPRRQGSEARASGPCRGGRRSGGSR
jgi:hypothetical protein